LLKIELLLLLLFILFLLKLIVGGSKHNTDRTWS
jgi:hypothetical protein